MKIAMLIFDGFIEMSIQSALLYGWIAEILLKSERSPPPFPERAGNSVSM
jgi:hypothetical protein